VPGLAEVRKLSATKLGRSWAGVLMQEMDEPENAQDDAKCATIFVVVLIEALTVIKSTSVGSFAVFKAILLTRHAFVVFACFIHMCCFSNSCTPIPAILVSR